MGSIEEGDHRIQLKEGDGSIRTKTKGGKKSKGKNEEATLLSYI